MPRPSAPDVVVVGAGPAGCATALAFADAGARTVLLEAVVPATQRLAGEWLHPPGVRVLERLGVDLHKMEHCRVGGFLIHPEDGGELIRLPYAEGRLGLTCHHSALVEALRAASVERDEITLVPGAKVTGVKGTRVTYTDPHASSAACSPTAWLVGAEGRASPTRRSLGIPADLTRLSQMAGVLLEDVELSDPDFGHVLLGGPGPVFLYRIGPRTVRVCIDVPRNGFTTGRVRDYLWEEYSSWFPTPLRAALGCALEGGSTLGWAANQFRPRVSYGHDRVALVGDAVGCLHPLTAVGLTHAFADGECLARAGSLAAYGRERTAATQVAEILSTALYRTFTTSDPATMDLRFSVYEMLRRSAHERERTMALLAADETRLHQFSAAFLHALGLAATARLRGAPDHSRPAQPVDLLRGYGGWVTWLAAAAGHAGHQRSCRAVGVTPRIRTSTSKETRPRWRC